MISQELVDRWFVSSPLVERTELRLEAQSYILKKIEEKAMDLKNPERFIFSDKLFLKRHLGLNTLSTHFNIDVVNYRDCLVEYLQGNIIAVSDETGITELLITRNLNFYASIRVIEYLEQGKILIDENC